MRTHYLHLHLHAPAAVPLQQCELSARQCLPHWLGGTTAATLAMVHIPEGSVFTTTKPYQTQTQTQTSIGSSTSDKSHGQTLHLHGPREMTGKGGTTADVSIRSRIAIQLFVLCSSWMPYNIICHDVPTWTMSTSIFWDTCCSYTAAT